nr:putative ribonuclease H-like domain-containing protein [Tanacetum cinerariifolium]
VSDSEGESETKTTQNVLSFVQPTEQVKSPRPSVQHVEKSTLPATPKSASPKSTGNGKRRNRKTCFVCKSLDHLIKDCDYHEKKMAQTTARNHAHRSKSVPITAVRPVSTAVHKTSVTRPQQVKPYVTKSNSLTRRHINHILSPKASNSPPRDTAVKALIVNAAQDKGVIDSGCLRHMTGKMSYLSNFEELNGGYVAFGGNPKNRVLVTKPHNRTPYELLLGRTPSIGFIRPFGCPVTILNTLDSLGSGPTWLFNIDTLTKTMNYQPVTAGNQSNPSASFQDKFDAYKAGEEINKQYVLFPVWFSGFTNPHNIDGDANFDEKEPEFDEKKPEFEVNVSQAVVLKFEDFFNDSINEFNVADASQLPDDPDMLEMEDITYSDDEDNVGAEADFNNLETSITVSPILTTRVHKDHPNPRGYIKLLKIQVGLKLCRRSFFNSRCRRNKKDERDIVVRNKARLVAQGHIQEEGIDYEEVFAPVAKIEAIRLFLAYASFMGFLVYQMDVKSTFLYGTIEEEVYVCQPPRFKDPDYPDKVYKVVKALYGLHQAPRAWYETLANYLLENGFQRGKIDQTLFIKRQKGDILLVQIYVDDIIFGSTNNDFCKSFEKLIKDKFQMSSMGELTFFLSLQVKQKKDGIFISQDKYVAENLRKFGLTDRKSAST